MAERQEQQAGSRKKFTNTMPSFHIRHACMYVVQQSDGTGGREGGREGTEIRPHSHRHTRPCSVHPRSHVAEEYAVHVVCRQQAVDNMHGTEGRLQVALACTLGDIREVRPPCRSIA